MAKLTLSVTFLLATALAAPAFARPYVTVHDDGTLQAFRDADGPDALTGVVLALYQTTGQPMPDVLSVWTNFGVDANIYETLEVQQSNDVAGIGFENFYGGNGQFDSPTPPLRTILVHNDITKLTQRAAFQRASTTGFGRYLFLLELGHMFTGEVSIPKPNPGELQGSPFHWSFWMDAGGSIDGGNQWKDNGDGTFSTVPVTPLNVVYSMLDLYLMGLADSNEVGPFGILENATYSSGDVDPMSNGTYGPKSFPRFDPTPLTVTATKRALTITDVITANGVRNPAHAQAPQKFNVGIMLVVAKSATAADVTAAQTILDPFVPTLPQAFNDATLGRGTLTIITDDTAQSHADGGVADFGTGGGADLATSPPGMDQGGCSLGGRSHGAPVAALLLFCALILVRFDKRRSSA
jgi:hypothetical protein